jgi:hypothetical protein
MSLERKELVLSDLAEIRDQLFTGLVSSPAGLEITTGTTTEQSPYREALESL